MKKRGYFYAGGARIANRDQYGAMHYEHAVPGTNSWVETREDNRYADRKERDPSGGELPLFDVNPDQGYGSTKGDSPLFIDGGDPFDYSSGRSIDGMPVSEAEFNRQTGGGAFNGAVGAQTGTDRHGLPVMANAHDIFHGAGGVSVWVSREERRWVDQEERWRFVTVGHWEFMPSGIGSGNGFGLFGGQRGGTIPRKNETKGTRDFPCPPTGEQLAGDPRLKRLFIDVYELAQKGRGDNRFIEVGGWIIMDRKGDYSIYVKPIGPDDKHDEVYLGSPPSAYTHPSGREIVIADFHTHLGGVSASPGDLNRAGERRVPGMIIRTGASDYPIRVSPYGPERGLWKRDLPRDCK
jgi:hypothetical protein